MSIPLPISEIAYYGAVGASFVPAFSFLCASAAALLPKKRREDPGEAAASAAFDKASLIHLDDFYIERPDGSLVQIDHAIKFPGGIAVVETKNWKGHFQAPIDAFSGEWTMSTGEGFDISAYDGANPFVQNESHADAVRAVMPAGVPVWNVVLMTHPDSMVTFAAPEDPGEEAFWADIQQRGGGMLPLEDFPGLWDIDDLGGIAGAMNSVPAVAKTEQAWEKLQKAARRDKAARKKHRTQVGADEPESPNRAGASFLLFLSGVACGALAAAFWAFQNGILLPYL